MSFAFLRTVRWPLLVKKKTELKEFFFFLSPWADIKKKTLFCSSRPGLRVLAPSFRHIHTSPGVFAVLLCHWSEVWRVCGDWTAMESLERTTVSVGEADNLYDKDTQMGNDLWKEVRRSLEIEFLVKKNGKKFHFWCAPSASVSSSLRRCSFLPADAWLQLHHPFSFVSKQQILVGALGRWEIDPHPTAVAGTQTQLCSSTNWFWQRWELRFKPN